MTPASGVRNSCAALAAKLRSASNAALSRARRSFSVSATGVISAGSPRAETGDRSWLNKVRPWYGHNTHFHVRLNCLPGDTACEAQDPPPPGDGCAEAREWQANILNPKPAPPADPDAPEPEPKREITMADLPGQCAAVLASD